MSEHVILAASRDRAASGRTIIGMMLAAAAFSIAVISQLGRFELPIVIPPETLPPQVITGGGSHRAVFAADAFGQCHADGRVNGVLLRRMLLDTGCTGELSLGSNMAASVGIDPASLSYDHTYNSANGQGREAVVTVRELRLFGNFVMHDVQTRISAAPQNQALVGIEILRRMNLRLIGGNCELSWR